MMVSKLRSNLLKSFHKPKWTDPREEILAQEEIALGGTALIFRSSYPNGLQEIEKVLLPKFQGKSEFEGPHRREFEILKTLHHPLILKPIRTFIQQTAPSIQTCVTTFEPIEGKSLAEFDSFLSTLSVTQRVQWTLALSTQLISVLNYLREEEIIHGDLAPDNLLVEKSGFIKLIDFGVARRLSDPPLSFRVLGRNYFRAPENRSKGTTSLKGDVYSIGRIIEYVSGMDLSSDPSIGGLIQTLTLRREIPHSVYSYPSGVLVPMKPLPDPDFFHTAGIVRERTKVIPSEPWFLRHPKIMRVACLVFMFLIFSSILPQRALLTVNTWPASLVAVKELGLDYRFDTPLIKVRVPSGKLRISFVIPSQKNRLVVQEVVALPGEHVKVFEDFQNVDSLEQ